MTDEKVARLLTAISEVRLVLKMKFLREQNGNWVVEDVRPV